MNKHTFNRAVQNIMRDNMYDRTVESSRGKINDKRLYRAHTGSNRVFKQKRANKGKRYNVNFILDVSGSMGRWGSLGNRKIETAIETLKAINSGFAGNGVEARVILFGSFVSGLDIKDIDDVMYLFDIHKYAEKRRERVKTISGDQAYRMPDFVRRDIVNGRHKDRITQNGKDPDGNIIYDYDSVIHHAIPCNHDYDALQKAYDVTRKNSWPTINIMIADGSPACDDSSYCGYDENKHRSSRIKGLVESHPDIPVFSVLIEAEGQEKENKDIFGEINVTCVDGDTEGKRVEDGAFYKDTASFLKRNMRRF